MTHVAVVDIGKTNIKLALVHRDTLAEIAVLTRPNTVLAGPPWPHFDLEGHWRFVLDALRQMQAAHGIDAISITAHGASAVLLDMAGGLAAPMLDYEHSGPDDLATEYESLRPPFAQTGSARLAGGLNLGAQVHWMFAQDPGLRERTARIVTYPQYWAYRLTGVASTERTSLGSHTDLWRPTENGFSSLPEALGIADKIAPLRLASDVLGPVLPAIAAQTGLAPDTPVACGIHDSNASLLPHLMSRNAPFSVVSTGTWVVVMGVGSTKTVLDPARDTLVNVNAFGAPVPSARFMGGREYDAIVKGPHPVPSGADMAEVLREGILLTPSLAASTGPFQGRAPQWHPAEPALGSGLRAAAAAFYCAMVTATCLRLIGHRGDIVVEGPFARNAAYLAMLRAATGCAVAASAGATGTSQGAALLIAGPPPPPPPPPEDGADAPADTLRDEMARYAARWRALVEGATP